MLADRIVDGRDMCIYRFRKIIIYGSQGQRLANTSSVNFMGFDQFKCKYIDFEVVQRFWESKEILQVAV